MSAILMVEQDDVTFVQVSKHLWQCDLIDKGFERQWFIMKRKDNSKKIVVSVLLLLVMICAAVYGVALYHGTPHGDNYIEMENE